MQVEGACIVEIVKLVDCVEHKEDPLIQIVRTHEHNTNSALLQTVNNFNKLYNYFIFCDVDVWVVACVTHALSEGQLY
jgi:hypothetical protein